MEAGRRGGVQVDGRSAPGRDGGVEAGDNREAESTGEIWSAIGDRSEVRDKWNERSKKGRINCGAEGIDKSVIEKKRQSLGFEQSLTEAWNPTTS